ncbi:MAG: VWA domain-containing protein [Planctomycetota bacterium]|nr:VWA domain-containing protein [Planctomycetota bacterium]
MARANAWRSRAPYLVGFGAACCAFAAWALTPVRGAELTPALDVVLIDASESCRRVRPQWARDVQARLAQAAEAARAKGHELAVFGFGADVVRWFGPAKAAQFVWEPAWAAPELRADATEVAAALEAARRLASQVQARADVVLYGDGGWTGEDGHEARSRIEAEGGSFQFELLSDAQLPDASLLELRAPRELESGAPLSIVVDYDAGTPRPKRLEARVKLADDRGTRERSFPLDSEQVAARLDLGPLGPGSTRIDVKLAAEGDPTPENDSATALVRTREALTICVVASPAVRGAAEQLAQTWRGLGLSASVEDSPAGLPRLSGTDVLVSLDVNPSAFEKERIEPFLNNGGGWLCCGLAALGNELTSAPRKTAAQWLPLELDDGDEERDVLLVVDVSGSMSGPEFDRVRNAAIALGGAARPLDRVTLRLFTDQLSRPYDLGFGGDRTRDEERARILMRLRPPGGPTDLVHTLEELVDEREASGRKALLFLLTDGRDESRRSGAAERARIAIERLGGARTRIVTLVSGADPDLQFLRNLDAPDKGAEVRTVEGDLAELLESELAEDWILPGPSPLFEDSRGQALAAEITAAFDFAALELGPCVAMALREGDLSLARERDGRPMLALRSVGDGLAATLATLPGELGSPSFVRAPQAWLPLVRALGRGRVPTDELPTLRWQGWAGFDLKLAEGARWRAKEFSRPRVEWVPERDASGGSAEPIPLEVEPISTAGRGQGTSWSLRWPELREPRDPTRGFLRVVLRERSLALDLPRFVPEEFRKAPQWRPGGVSMQGVSPASSTSHWTPRAPTLGTWSLVLGLAALALGTVLGGASAWRRRESSAR